MNKRSPKLIANHGRDLCVMFLDTKLSSHSVSLHKGVKMAKAKCEKKLGGGLFDKLAAFCGRGTTLQDTD